MMRSVFLGSADSRNKSPPSLNITQAPRMEHALTTPGTFISHTWNTDFNSV